MAHLTLKKSIYALSSPQLINTKWRDPKGVLLILDRSFDMVSPLMHGYSYQTLVADLVGINQLGMVKVKNYEGKQNEESKDETAEHRFHTLDEADKIWIKYRGKHIANVLLSLSHEVDKFSEEN